MTARVPNRPIPRRTHGFTLVELLLVIIIIAAIISLVLPSLGKARKTAKAASSLQLMTNFISASSAFYNDERKLPGYFQARTMGHQENLSRGMSGAENAMLDLSGGVTTASDPEAIKVGPTATGTGGGEPEIYVNVDLIGVPGAAGNKSYFAPKGKNYVAQTSDGGSLQHQHSTDITSIRHTAQEGQPQLPDLVDDFGNPFLVWTKDDTFLGDITQLSDFARESSGMGTDIAQFYWAQNAAFLKSNSLGRMGEDQTDAASGRYSLIGDGARAGAGDYVTSLAGVLGNPGYPDDLTKPFKTILPRDGRGSIIIQSAGADGFYFGSEDRGGKNAVDGILYYGISFKNVDDVRYVDDQGRPESQDLFRQFDDLIQTGGK